MIKLEKHLTFQSEGNPSTQGERNGSDGRLLTEQEFVEMSETETAAAFGLDDMFALIP